MKRNLPPSSKKKFINVRTVLVFAAGLIAGVLAGTLPGWNKEGITGPHDKISELRSGGYKYINPLLECDNFKSSNLRVHASLENELTNYVESTVASHRANHISVYYRDLNNGPWIGVNEHFIYTPASLLKVPIMIGVLKMVEKDTALLSKKMDYPKAFEAVNVQNVGNNKAIVPGQSYTVRELLEYMIWYSDNEAATVLIHIIGDDGVTRTILDMGINLTQKDVDGDFISVKEYSSFFRVLYNASYLSREMSEYALELLSTTTFNDGLPARLPSGVIVSHKFGERDLKATGEKQLHDCGIVYAGDSPYLLCVMTRGKDFKTLASVIAEVSEMVYNKMTGK